MVKCCPFTTDPTWPLIKKTNRPVTAIHGRHGREFRQVQVLVAV